MAEKLLKIALVYRSGGDYAPDDVKTLVAQLPATAEIICLTDAPFVMERVTCIPLTCPYRGMRGWWAKIDLFRPDITDDLLYFDLDTVITGDIKKLITTRRDQMVMLTDFYHPQYLMSSVMYIPNSYKARIWNTFWADPQRHVDECTLTSKWGDQGFIRGVIGDCLRWQDVCPNWFVSYKADVVKVGESPFATKRYSKGDGSLPKGARVVIFHGNPRPYESGEPWLPEYLYAAESETS
ncbi:hypothetical protein [Pantoea sp. CCBC3-3-1]|uniref:hypothetical protein n=1 Tax=Pantoea sp. CCBC3-3-1 TaxID=2490851 RepID=UPI0020C23C6F|nr:hypothetical protein [Pantoea sp. CCBC3-3-1]